MDALDASKLLDEELYSRQLYVLGSPAMQRIQGARVLVSGLQGLGAEVAKNLVLMGVGSLTLHDPHPTCWSDLAAQFLLSEQHLERSRAEASQEFLAQLNRAVQVIVHTGDITEDLLLDFQVVVLTAAKLEEQLKVGTLCHKHGVCFLAADTRGLVGQLFCDFGEDFTVQDPTEAEPLTAAIQHISQGSPGILTLRKGANTHYFRDGDLVTFSGIEGMAELNDCDPRSIHVREDGSLEIGDTTTFSRYLRGGAITEVKRPKTVRHKSLDTALLQPHVVAQSSQEVHRAHCLHQAFRALHKFQHLHGRPPHPWDPVDAETVVGLARDLEPLKRTEEEPLEQPLDEALVRTVALSSAGVLSPMVAMLGAVAAQEVLKAISRKFMPLDQWLYFDALDCLPEDGELLPSPEDCAPRGSRYDGQIAVFGAGFQEKLSRQHYLLVGAGAIGCELLKVFALVGLGAGNSGGLTVVDMDHIERSNLSRQLLFRSQDVGWARHEFEGLFRRSAETINHHQQAHTSLADMDEPQTLTLLKPVLGVLRVRPQNWQDCVAWALGHWKLCFHYGIKQLLRHFPPNKVLEDGTPFWSGPKQCPQPLEFDTNQDTHLLYVLAAANLYAQMHGLPGSQDWTALRELLKLLPQPDPQQMAPIFASNLELASASAEFGPEQQKELNKALEVWSVGPPLKPLMFEKDDDSNFHMDFVSAAASLRCQNYGIPPVNRAQSKRIVGQIIPAIATTTAAVAGLLGLELYKVVGGPRPRSAFRHSYLHLAENYLIRYMPFAPAIQTFHHLKWTCWDRLKVPAGQPERTLESLLAHLQEQHGLRVRILLHGSALLYSAGWPPEKQAQHLPLRVTELVQQLTRQVPAPGQQVLVLELSCEGDEEDTAFPPLHYEL
ncbi:ubiquitin-like modifier-activating enzyme 7 isoform X5 [Pongo pygmaeus]|uniref:ubiquitin-like modifier-activating enzyme 7 isoform X5 n=1 Tax=Pongo abelii TaxID=9601 RepID=UPI000CEF91F2|nr:ubiquitin-like modifier-activating enzyme 7 isoform X3 [Pongo abelii]XP_054337966.1 ubiquitin-like modifier-activating enzyme 7 isoform X4 [Pongo pygmaeus]